MDNGLFLLSQLCQSIMEKV